MKIEYKTGSKILLKAYEKQYEKDRFAVYSNYAIAYPIVAQLRAYMGDKNVEPMLTYAEWKKPVKNDSEHVEFLSEEKKKEIREHTRNFGRR